MNKTELLADPTINIKEANKIGEELYKKYATLEENQLNRYKKTQDLNELKIHSIYLKLRSYCLHFYICSRRSRKMFYELNQVIEDAEELGVELL